MPRNDDDRSHALIGAALIAAMGVYAIAGTILAIALESWWPILIGLGCLVGVVCFALAVSMVLDSRKSKQVPSPEKGSDLA